MPSTVPRSRVAFGQREVQRWPFASRRYRYLPRSLLMEEATDPYVPTSMVLMGGPINTRVTPTVINHFAEKRGTDWFRRNVITTVPLNYRGFLRKVYPGFIQLSRFLGLNLDRHIARHREYFFQLVHGDRDSAEKHRGFYDEYRAVMDLTARYGVRAPSFGQG